LEEGNKIGLKQIQVCMLYSKENTILIYLFIYTGFSIIQFLLTKY